MIHDSRDSRYGTNEPECPYCGHIEPDAWELPFGDGDSEIDLTCGSCERDYLCERVVLVTYNTHPKQA